MVSSWIVVESSPVIIDVSVGVAAVDSLDVNSAIVVVNFLTALVPSWVVAGPR